MRNLFYDNDSQKLKDEIEAYLKKGVQVGDRVRVEGRLLKYNPLKDPVFCPYVEVLDVRDSGILVRDGFEGDETTEISNGFFTRDTLNIGSNPFNDNGCLKNVKYRTNVLSAIVGSLFTEGPTAMKLPDGGTVEVPELNWEPVVGCTGGLERSYTRGFCWDIPTKQKFIDSIYKGRDCGTVIIRERSVDYVRGELAKGNTEVAFADIVDGKQRLGALHDFLTGQITDSYGNYFGDLSGNAKRKFAESSVLTLKALPETATDEEVMEVVMAVNEHLVPYYFYAASDENEKI